MALMRRFIDWVELHTEHGRGSWAAIDNVVTVRTHYGTKSAQLNGQTPATLARVLMHELSIEHKD
jgi:hypothetical protein